MHKDVALPENIIRNLHQNLTELEESSPLMREQYVKKLFSQIDIITDLDGGMAALYQDIGRLINAGIFKDTLWENPEKLVPSLVGGTLKVGGGTTQIEILSELRFLAIYKGDYQSKAISSTQAREFLEDTISGNLELVFPDVMGHNYETDAKTQIRTRNLFAFILEELPMESIKKRLATEIELICLQRPVVTDRVLVIISILRDHFELQPGNPIDQRLAYFVRSVYSPSQKAGESDTEAYLHYLDSADPDALRKECDELGSTMRETGLATGYHAVLLRKVVDQPSLLKTMLGLDNTGKAELVKHLPFIQKLISEVIHVDNARSCYGLARFLERGLLSQQAVITGLQRLLEVNMHKEVAERIRQSRPDSSLVPLQILTGDTLSILGLPLGIGQGLNPTCQSARGISLWSRHAPGKLLRMIITAAQSNNLSMRFEGETLESENLGMGLATELDLNLDAVSVVLVPHLDRIYNEMMNRASFRGEDPHKWVNPAMYGQWIPTGFISAYNEVTQSINNYDEFIRIFYASHHPEYNGGFDLAYPNPVGIFLTTTTGKLIGFHAVSILRVRKNKGSVRIYFLNPNNEGRQRWQSDIEPTVAGNGEQAGESSLPFYQFASRVYAFHYHASDIGDLSTVDRSEVDKVREIAQNSWGESYIWSDQTAIH
ncbi:MAG: hypothetical protein WD097_09250 [Balneolales bacterium]